jgi:UDP-glucose 4-epimerase
MKALVTGGAGFIGSHLSERLLKDGNEIVVLDNLSTGRLENISSIREHPKFRFVEGDIRDRELMLVLADRADVIFHLAAAVGVQLIADDPVRTIETNIAGTQTVLEAANKFGRRILIASSSEVYGKSEDIPFCEEADIVLGSTSLSRWAYACSKAIDEFLGIAFHRQYGLEVVIGRFFNTIGPRQTGRYGMVVPRFVRWALRNEPIMVCGTGKQSRCFCYVDDLTEAVIRLIKSKDATGKVFNIGSVEEITIEELADTIIRMTGSKSKKKYVAYEVAYGRAIDDMMRRMPSLELIKQTIGWEPKTELTAALQKVIDHERLNNLR